MQTILVTGGAGYIGTHTVLQLLESGYNVVVLDNLSNSSFEGLQRVGELVGKQAQFHKGDIRSTDDLDLLFNNYSIDAVVHFAGLKSVGESVEDPLAYYDNNVYGTVSLCNAMVRHGVNKIVFSSSATVYGDPISLPIDESMPVSIPTNPYGQSKLMCENILQDLYRSDSSWDITLLRYFNPVGAHESGLIGEDPKGTPNNLMPFISQVASGKREKLSVYGSDYATKDGTGVRDFIHVIDLANGHLKALKHKNKGSVGVFNLGTGKGYSVLEMVGTFEGVTGQVVDYDIVDRRPGDIGSCYADPALAEKELNWTAKLGLEDMCNDTWRWQSNNPNGYKAEG